MPVHEKMHVAGDGLDLSSETVKKGLAGRAGGPVEAATTVDTEAEGELPLGVTASIAVPTAVSATDPVARSGEADVAFTFPAGITKVEIVTRKQSDDSFVKKQDATASPAAVTGLTNGTAYDFYVRGIGSDGTVGRFAAKVSATPTA